MKYTASICRLTAALFNQYPANLYPELMLKPGRPYTCLAIEVFEDFTICIPFRSHISHNYAYLFTSTKRSKESRSGLDYTKMVLVNDETFYD